VTTATATSGTTLNITNCFSSTFDNYRILISNYLAASGSAITVQLGTGSALASGYYWAGNYCSAYTASPTVIGYGGANENQFTTHIVCDNTNQCGSSIDIYGANQAIRTSLVVGGVDTRTSGNPRLALAGFQNSATQFTSLHFASGAVIGNLTVTVYGYRKA